LVETGITTFLQCTFTESYNNLLCTIMVKTVQGWFFSLDEHLVEQKQHPQVLFVHAPMPLSVQKCAYYIHIWIYHSNDENFVHKMSWTMGPPTAGPPIFLRWHILSTCGSTSSYVNMLASV
jgi:hypothetical protein